MPGASTGPSGTSTRRTCAAPRSLAHIKFPTESGRSALLRHGALGTWKSNSRQLPYRDPGGTLIDFIRAALGRLRIKSREEKIEETFRAWLVSRSLTPDQAGYLCLLKNRGIATGRVRLDDLFEPPLSILDAAGKGIELFGEAGLRTVVDDLNAGVFDIAS